MHAFDKSFYYANISPLLVSLMMEIKRPTYGGIIFRKIITIRPQKLKRVTEELYLYKSN